MFLSILAEFGSDRLTVSQASFFLAAAEAEAMGKPATRTELIQSGQFRPGIRNSYRQLTPASRQYPTGLGWLIGQADPDDDRAQFLRLSREGKRVLDIALSALAQTSSTNRPYNSGRRSLKNPNAARCLFARSRSSSATSTPVSSAPNSARISPRSSQIKLWP